MSGPQSYRRLKNKFLSVNRFDLPQCIDVGRKHETLGSEAEDFLSHSNSSSQNLHWFPVPEISQAT